MTSAILTQATTQLSSRMIYHTFESADLGVIAPYDFKFVKQRPGTCRCRPVGSISNDDNKARRL